VHPNSHASMVADPASVNTAPETLNALRTHGLLPVVVRELTEPTPYGPDGDEGDGCDADLEEKLTRFVSTPRHWPFFCSPFMIQFLNIRCSDCRLLHTYVIVHGGTFDGPEKKSLRTFVDSKIAMAGSGETGLSAEELRALKNALP
jgi:hsp70-interacting protein